MKKVLYIFAVMTAAVCCFAQQHMPMVDTSCEGWMSEYPDYYCECHATSREFHYPLETEVGAQPMWFSTTIDDIKQGLSAYWISDDTITIEIYVFCASLAPAVTMSVGPNQMREMSIDEINEKLKAAGGMSGVLETLKPRIRVQTVHGRTGKVYCYPYDQGVKSTCDSAHHLFPRMTNVCDRTEEVYVLRPSNISSSGNGFIRWKQKKNLPANFRMTKDSCNGPEIARFTLSDSMRVHVFNADTMKALRLAGDSIYVHVSHDSGYVGRVMYHNVIRWNSQVVDTVICQGKALQLADTVLRESTEYGGDTLWSKADILSLTGYRLTVEAPAPVYDTLRLKAKQLPYTYRNNIIPKDGWGDYDFTVHQTDKCDERYLLHVEHNFVTATTVIDTTLCLGKTITINNISYSQDTVIRDSVWTYAAATNNTPDTYTIRDIAIHFTEPETEYDTIAVPPTEMAKRGYYYYSALAAQVHYGDTLIVKKKNNTCTRYIQLHVDKNITIIEQDIDTTLCLGKAMRINEKIYYSDTLVYDTLMLDGDEWIAGNITIHFTEPETEYDTISVVPMLMGQEGYLYEALGVMVTYGDTLIERAEKDMCTRWISLHVDTAAIPVTEIDTALCLGKSVVFGETAYSADTTFRDTVMTAPDTWTIRDITIRFTDPEMEYDTLFVSPEQGMAAGDTLIVITEENECTRWIMTHVVLTEAIDNTTAPGQGAYKYIRHGVLYIRRGENDYDLFGRPINSKQ